MKKVRCSLESCDKDYKDFCKAMLQRDMDKYKKQTKLRKRQCTIQK